MEGLPATPLGVPSDTSSTKERTAAVSAMSLMPVIEQKNGLIQSNESFGPVMNNLVAAFPWTKSGDLEVISRNLKARLLADSCGNWELALFLDTASSASKIVHS